MELDLKILRQNDIPFIPIAHEKGVIVKDINGNETTLDTLLIKDSDLSLSIKDGVISHTNEVIPQLQKGLMKIAYDSHGHITAGEELKLSDDLFETEDHKLKINYNTIQ